MTSDIATDRLGPRDGTIRLPTKADLSEAPALLARLKDASGDVVLDASQVKVLTTPIVQVLLSAADAFRKNGRSLSLDTISEAAESCLAELGIGPEALARTAVVKGGKA